jgi:transposase InsO family protein
MPWKESNAMKERTKFVLEWERRWNEGEGHTNVAQLCREFGISRETGYVWLRRFQDGGHDVRALEERPRRPRTSPTAFDEDVADLVAAARKKHPLWGPRKLYVWLAERHADIVIPKPSTITTILRRRGLSQPRKRVRRTAPPRSQPFAKITGPNATWCVDFKGHFRTGDGRWCYPLTILDAHSRFLVRCEVVKEPSTKYVSDVFDSAFTEFGLPSTIRSDNGSPFASTGAGGLTGLSVWWVRLGITPERIEPGKPQQNGRQERFHRTLKAATSSPPKDNARLQQHAFDLFRREYNEERPHQGIGMKRPTQLFEPSPRRYPRKLMTCVELDGDEYDVACEHPFVDKHGYMDWRGHRLFVGTALSHETLTLDPQRDTALWAVRFGPIHIGHIDEQRIDRGIIMPKKTRAGVSGMSLKCQLSPRLFKALDRAVSRATWAAGIADAPRRR